MMSIPRENYRREIQKAHMNGYKEGIKEAYSKITEHLNRERDIIKNDRSFGRTEILDSLKILIGRFHDWKEGTLRAIRDKMRAEGLNY